MLLFSCIRYCFEQNTRKLIVYLRILSDNSHFLIFLFFIFGDTFLDAHNIYDIIYIIYIYIYIYIYTYIYVIILPADSYIQRKSSACITYVHHIPKCISCHKATVVRTRRGHCFYEYIRVMLISVRFEHFVCYGSFMTTYNYIWFLQFLLKV